MPPQLNDDDDDGHGRGARLARSGLGVGDKPHVLTRLVNCLRMYNIPVLNFLIVGVLGTFLVKLTFKYKNLYMKSSLITIIITNLVLYGISETLAQSILSYVADSPMISIRWNEHSTIWERNLARIGSNDQYRDSEFDSAFDDSEGVERFIDFLEADEEEAIADRPANLLRTSSSTISLTYFKFNRLAGFMCWGMIMGFVQCFWYKFLQIYYKDPKFIEVLRKVLTDQLCYSPISLFCFFTYGTMVLENGTWEDAKAKINSIYLGTLLINYSVWFPVQFINFLLVPRTLQVPFSSSISVLWNCFLSIKNSGK